MNKVNKKLTDSEIKDLVRLLKKVQLPAPYPVFLALCKSVPLIAVDLALMPDKDHVFLTYRKDEFYKGWHIPGSILIFDESVERAVKRVARKELGISKFKSSFINYSYYRDTREGGISLLFFIKSKYKARGGKYFHIDNLPKNFLKAQDNVMNVLRDWRKNRPDLTD